MVGHYWKLSNVERFLCVTFLVYLYCKISQIVGYAMITLFDLFSFVTLMILFCQDPLLVPVYLL